MEKFIRPHDKEYMRMAMLKHEEMFRAQVYELHRLYHNQKILMKHFRKEKGQNQDGWNPKHASSLNQFADPYDKNQKPQQHIDSEQPADKDIAESQGNEALEIEDESEIELTLGPTCYYRRMKAEMFLTSDSGPSFCSTSTGSRYLKRTNLGKPQKKDTIIKESTGQNWGLLELPETNSGFLDRGRNSSNVAEQLKQKQPPWLFLETLSLNMT